MHTRLLAATGLTFAVAGLAASAGGAYAYFWDQARADVIAAGVQIAGVPVGGLKAPAARLLVQREIVAPLAQPLRLDSGTWSTTLERSQAGIRVDVGALVTQALSAGRHDSLDRRLLRTIRGRSLAASVPLHAAVSTTTLAQVLGEVSAALYRPPIPAHVDPSAASLRIIPSADGVQVDAARFWAALRAALLDPSVSTLTVPTVTLQPAVTTDQLAARFPAYLVIDREHYTLRLFRHLKLARVYPIAVGRAGLETPAGLYRINDRQTNPSWHVPLSSWAGSLAGKIIPPGPADPIKARWLGFHDGAGIHGTTEDWSIGHAASHGCIRMHIPDVIALYPLVPMGTPIYVG